MNLLLVAIVSVILATGVFNTEPEVSEENKKTEVIVMESSEIKQTEAEVKTEAQAQAEAEAKAAAEAQAQAEAKAQEEAKTQEASKEIDSSRETGTNYLMLALYIFGSILVISIGAYFYLRQRDNLSPRSVTRTSDSPRRDFSKEVSAEPQEEQTTEEEVKSEPQEQEEQTTEDEAKSTPQEEQPSEDEKK